MADARVRARQDQIVAALRDFGREAQPAVMVAIKIGHTFADATVNADLRALERRGVVEREPSPYGDHDRRVFWRLAACCPLCGGNLFEPNNVSLTTGSPHG